MTAEPLRVAEPSEQFSRTLEPRHILMIGLGGAMGVGLFLGSAQGIHLAGPAIMLAYAIAGLMIYIVVRALGELLLYRPISGSFTVYAAEFIGPCAGFLTGWSYWLQWVLVGIAEITAIGIYCRYWFPALPQWIPALGTLLVLYLASLRPVRLYGEIQFWVSTLKVVAVTSLILLGVWVLLCGSRHVRDAAVSNLWTHGGFFPTGTRLFVLAFPVATFAFGGIELIGVTAGEAESPEESIPRAIGATFHRMFFLYLGVFLVILCLIPWNSLDRSSSPFVAVFSKLQMPIAARGMTLVVICAAAAACSSGIFSSGRMLYALALAGQSPRVLARLSSERVPANGIHLSVAAMLLGVVLNGLIPERIFGYVIDTVLVTQLWTWSMILIAHLQFRRAVAKGWRSLGSFRLPLSPFSNWLVLGYIGTITVVLCTDPATAIVRYLIPIWFGGLLIAYALTRSAARAGAEKTCLARNDIQDRR